MNIRFIRRVLAATVFLIGVYTPAQEKPHPQFTIDLKPLGAAPDLFTDSSDSKYGQRGVINVFWLGNDRIAVAFSTNRRWSGVPKPEPLQVKLLIFDSTGKQQASREWNIGADGPDGQTTLEVTPGPDDSILVIHESNSAGRIPDGDFIQVLNPDTSLRQDLYIPATSRRVPAILPNAGLVIETYYANKHSSLAWWTGKPLKPGPPLELPAGQEETLVGPGVAARAFCENPPFGCSGVRIFRAEKSAWFYTLPELDLVPLPRVFLAPEALVIELRP